MWKLWPSEYESSFRDNTANVEVSEVLTQSMEIETKNRNQWKLAVVNGFNVGRDGVVRAAKLRTSKGNLEREVQHLYPLELTCIASSH